MERDFVRGIRVQGRGGKAVGGVARIGRRVSVAVASARVVGFGRDEGSGQPGGVAELAARGNPGRVNAGGQSRRAMRGFGRESGFTLVELLVVIGIIAVLIGILLPTLGKAREQAKSTMCAARMRDIGNCFAAYLAENKGMGCFYGFPLATPPGFTGAYSQFWCFTSSTPTGGTLTYDFSQGYMSKYFKNNAMLNCPAVEDFFPIKTVSIPDAPPISYGYNANGSFRNTKVFTRFSNIRKPFETVALADSAEPRENTLNYAYQCQLPSNRVPNFHGRHRGMGNVLWYDGHVSTQEPYVLSSSLTTNYLSVNYLAMKDMIVKTKLGVLVPFTKAELPEDQFAGAAATRVNYYFFVDKTKGQ